MDFQEFMNDYATYILLAVGALILIGLIIFKRYMSSKQSSDVSGVQDHLLSSDNSNHNHPDELSLSRDEQQDQPIQQENENMVCDPSTGECINITTGEPQNNSDSSS